MQKPAEAVGNCHGLK